MRKPGVQRRHRWIHPKKHVYVCYVCGTGKVNSRDEAGWGATWHRPDGTDIVGGRTPPCVPGPRTAMVLVKYALEIAIAKKDPTLPPALAGVEAARG